MRSNNLSAHDGQAELALARKPETVTVPVELVRMKKSKGAAFTLACDTSGLEEKRSAER